MTEQEERPKSRTPRAGTFSGAIGITFLIFAGWLALGELREAQEGLFMHGFFAPLIWIIDAVMALIGVAFLSIAAARWIRASRRPNER